MNPAFEESAMFENMIDLMFQNEYDVYVFDNRAHRQTRGACSACRSVRAWGQQDDEEREEARTLRELLSFTKKKRRTR